MYLQGNYFSSVLNRTKAYTAVLPDHPNDQTKILFLLHGIRGDERDWVLNTPLLQYAEKYNTAFFCPAAENSFYTDHADGENYGEAMGKEFYEVVQRLYKLNFQRENVQIAGFSMGGYGAVLLGLRYSKLYSRIGAFSPAFVFYKKERQELHYKLVFSKGDYGSENDCLFQYQKCLTANEKIPPIQFACGEDDPLYEQTEKIIDQLLALDPAAKLEFFGQAGFHDFSLWNKDLLRFLESW